MRSNVVTLAAATIVTGASAAYAASETITMNAIDANGVGKEIGTLVLSDTQTGLQITPQLIGLPPGDHGFHVPTLIRIVARALDRMASQRPAWRLVAIMTQPTLANISDRMARATRATCPC